MGYTNVGAYAFGGVRYASKKALRDAITNGDNVIFDRTSMFPSDYGTGTYILSGEIQPGMPLTVVGPDPYTNRKWYATVEMRNGKLRVT